MTGAKPEDCDGVVKIFNPKTNRCVNKNGRIGRKILKEGGIIINCLYIYIYMFTNYLRKTRLYKKKILYSNRADKYQAKRYIIENFSDIINVAPLLYCDEYCDDIKNYVNYKKIIIKPTNSSGKYKIIDFKENNNYNKIQNQSNNWKKLTKNEYILTFYEKFYQDIKPKIIIEQYINIKEEFKFHTIYGKVCFIEHIFKNLKQCKWYTLNWEVLNIKCLDKPYKQRCQQNKFLKKYIKTVEKILSKDNFDYVRFDTYVDNNNKLFFGEFTFTPGSLKQEYRPICFDNLLFKFIKNKKINYQLLNQYTITNRLNTPISHNSDKDTDGDTDGDKDTDTDTDTGKLNNILEKYI